MQWYKPFSQRNEKLILYLKTILMLKSINNTPTHLWQQNINTLHEPKYVLFISTDPWLHPTFTSGSYSFGTRRKKTESNRVLPYMNLSNKQGFLCFLLENVLLRWALMNTTLLAITVERVYLKPLVIKCSHALIKQGSYNVPNTRLGLVLCTML